MSQENDKTLSWFVWIRRFGKPMVIILPFILLGWVLQQVPLDRVWNTYQELTLIQIVIWLVLNLGILSLMTFRWWLILHVLGFSIPGINLLRYRLGSFAISYFTPGPQVGGEPFQVLALQQRYQIPAASGTTSVSLDKLLDLIANFSFLAVGITIAFTGVLLPQRLRIQGLVFALVFLVFPLAYLISMLIGKKPLNRIINRFPPQVSNYKLFEIARIVEGEMSHFCVKYPLTILFASMISIVIWGGLLFEYWLLINYLGLQLSLIQSITAMVAARLSFLTPLPGGLGVLEASQVLTMQNLGFEASIGISVALLIRMRDFLFGMIGFLGIISSMDWRFPAKNRGSRDV